MSRSKAQVDGSLWETITSHLYGPSPCRLSLKYKTKPPHVRTHNLIDSFRAGIQNKEEPNNKNERNVCETKCSEFVYNSPVLVPGLAFVVPQD